MSVTPVAHAGPQVTLVSPGSDAALGPATPVVLDVTDAEADLVLVVLWVHYAETGETEVVWTGDGYVPRYGSSTREAVAGGWRFTVVRAGGWHMAPDLRVKAIDAEGNEAS